ncbi:hypothetical protein [Megamonas hypermegale]|uniref:hypothetical protein n=1 Tax=Megamonas hypermegale TaxID=158847 RepID=UPI00255C900E|nr:hypothetical protein [Megamonas hypermegale]
MKNLLLQLKDNNGFVAMDMLIVMAIVMASAVVWSSASLLMSAQQQNSYRTAAIFLVQGELNKLEYAIENNAILNLEAENVDCGEQQFILQKEVIEQDEQFLLKVKVVWYYEDNLQQEQQERIIVKK